MFGNCINLKSLDISNFNLNNISYNNTFYGVKLKYINIYNVIYNSYESTFLNESLIQYSIDNGLMVCEKEKIIEGDNVTYGCCLFDVDNLICVNYLKVKYGNEVEYKNGFGFTINNDKGEENKYRTDVYYIQNEQNYLLNDKNFNITKNSEIIIYFKEKLKNIEHFF